MKKYILKSLLCLILITSAGIIKAQKEWTLEQCIGYALDNNIQIKRQELQSDIARNNLNQSKFELLPDLNLGGSHNLGSGRAPDYSSFQYSNSLSSGNIGLQSNLTIFRGFQRINTIKMYKYTFLSTQQSLAKAKNDISLEIASAYLQILFNDELLEVAKNQKSISSLQVEKTKKLVEVGNVARGSLLEIIAQEAADEASVTDRQNQLNLSYISLAQMLDLDTISNFKISIPTGLTVPETYSGNSDSIYLIAKENLPQVKIYENQLKSSQYDLAIARGSRLPQLSLTGNYYTQYNLNAKTPPLYENKYPFKDQLKDNLYKQVNINLSIPIFSRFQISKNISNARINVKDNEFALKQAQLTLRKEVEQACADALAAFKNYQSRNESVAAFEENYKYVQQKFDVGLVNTVDYNIAKNNFTKAKSDLLQAKYEFIFKTKIIEFYKGNIIKL
jgi:outer membrane protein